MHYCPAHFNDSVIVHPKSVINERSIYTEIIFQILPEAIQFTAFKNLQFYNSIENKNASHTQKCCHFRKWQMNKFRKLQMAVNCEVITFIFPKVSCDTN